MKRLETLILMAVLLVAGGCATQAVTLSTLDNAGELVTAEVSRFNVLGLSALPMETATELLKDLNSQCDGKGVTGITTRTSNTWAVIGVIEKIEATGYCKV